MPPIESRDWSLSIETGFSSVGRLVVELWADKVDFPEEVGSTFAAGVYIYIGRRWGQPGGGGMRNPATGD